MWGTIATATTSFSAFLGAANEDPDQDGLTNAQEALGTDPWSVAGSVDTNGDGIPDGVAVAGGMSARNPDMDGDGLANAAELAIGGDPSIADTDGDGVVDGADAFPVDPTRSAAPSPVPGDTTPPTIDLTEPTNAVLISTVA